jgi:hypothetical protein
MVAYLQREPAEGFSMPKGTKHTAARLTVEHRRLAECREQGAAWKKWGPYLSERQWGTVREDYSDGGDAPPQFIPL